MAERHLTQIRGIPDPQGSEYTLIATCSCGQRRSSHDNHDGVRRWVIDHRNQSPPPPAASEAGLRAELIAFELYRAQTALPEYVAEAERIVNGYLAARAAAGGT